MVKKKEERMGCMEMIVMLGMALFSLAVILGVSAFAISLLWKSITG